jgi:hypothetical protein
MNKKARFTKSNISINKQDPCKGQHNAKAQGIFPQRHRAAMKLIRNLSSDTRTSTLSASHRRRYRMGDAQVVVIDADGEFL